MTQRTPDKSKIRQLCESRGIPVVDAVLKALKAGADEGEKPVTIFAACPNSEAVAKASIRAAHRASAPIKFAATLNQVDTDGGYTRWTQAQFMEVVRNEVAESGYKGPAMVALDHGGQWLKDKQALEKYTLEQATEGVKKSLEACIDAGYDLLHIDPTVDKTLPKGEIISIDVVCERTIELIVHSEKHRRSKGYPRISYEVGTEEVHGGLADMKVFERFLNGLKDGLKANGMEDVWPCFVVGKVGTDLHTTLFDPEVAKKLVTTAAKWGSFIKGHYSDSVENPEDYPKSGMGGANVGPEFTEAEYAALSELTEKENELVKAGKLEQNSGVPEALKNAVVRSGRWEKWRLADEQGLEFDQLSQKRQEWLIRTGCRYIWTEPDVLEARGKLYKHLESQGIAAEDYVIDEIVKVMDKYFRTFNLYNTIERIEKRLEKM